MTVYVESNFVLEIALGQGQSYAAEVILSRAERGEIALALPALALTEPFSTVAQRSRRLQQLRNQLTEQLRELSRSTPHEEDVQALTSMPAYLASIEQRELARLISTVSRLYSVGIVIPIENSIYGAAITATEQMGLSPQDAMIYSAVLEHLRARDLPGPHLFISKNWRDFSGRRMRAELATLSCELHRSFDEAEIVLSNLPSD